jgi:hypothetical protein
MRRAATLILLASLLIPAAALPRASAAEVQADLHQDFYRSDRFLDVFDGDYYLVVEYENKEVARAQIYISTTSPLENKQDISLEWRASGLRNASGGGVVSAADIYNRSGPNKLLYKKSAQQITSKDYGEAISTLLQVVAIAAGIWLGTMVW